MCGRFPHQNIINISQSSRSSLLDYNAIMEVVITSNNYNSNMDNGLLRLQLNTYSYGILISAHRFISIVENLLSFVLLYKWF